MTAIFKRMSTAEFESRVERATRSKSAPVFSFSRLVGCMESGMLDGYENEVVTELRRVYGGAYDQFRMPIPVQLLADPSTKLNVLTRDLNLASDGSEGGYLVGTDNAPVADLLRPWSVVANAGCTVIPAPVGGSDLVIPRTTSGMAGYWLDGESAEMTQSDMQFDKITLQPKTVAAYGKYSRLLAKQTSIADGLLQKDMLMSLGRLLDIATLAGTGANGQPTGLLNIAGTNAATGAFSLASALTMEQASADAAGDDEQFGYVTTPAVRKLLKARALDAGGAGELIWRSAPTGDTLAGRKAWAANYVSASTVIAGPWSDCVVAMWGAPELVFNPYGQTNFRNGMVEVKMVLNCDIKFLHPAAWSKHTAVS